MTPKLRKPTGTPTPTRLRALVPALGCALLLSCYAGNAGTPDGAPTGSTVDDATPMPDDGNAAVVDPNASTTPTPSPGDGNKNPAGSPNGTTPADTTTPVAVVGPAPTSSAGDGSATIGPSYTADANMGTIAGVPQGRWCQFVANGADSNFYTGNDPLLSRSYAPIKRNVYVYVPAGYVSGTVSPVLIENDAQWAKGYLDHVLDNLIAKGALPKLVAVSIDNGGGDSRGSERGLEYDVVSGKFGEFIDQELLPLAEQKCGVKVTKNPALRAALGFSSSGAAAIGMGWWHPELYGRLITYSATMIAQFPTDDYPDGAWAYPSKLMPNAEKKNLRIFLAAGQNDNQAGQNNNRDFLLANRNAAKTFEAKGYAYQFFYGLGAGHVDGRLVNQTLPAALTWAWRGWEKSTP